MKKVLITLTAICLAMVANAQFVLGVDASVNLQNQKSIYSFTNPDTSYMHNLAKSHGFGYSVGLRAGYQINRLRVGIGFEYSSHSLDTNFFVDTLSNVEWYNKMTASTISGSIFARYNFVEIGDISIFAQLDASVGIIPNVKYHNYSNVMALISGDNEDVIDTTFTGNAKTLLFGVSVVPGVSWQISPYCSLDLYIDLLRLGFNYVKLTTKIEAPYSTDGEKIVMETTTSGSEVLFGCKMSPNSLYDDLSLFRLGFNLTF